MRRRDDVLTHSFYRYFHVHSHSCQSKLNELMQPVGIVRVAG